MPPLDNPRHERFAQELAKGKSQAEAYQTAGYKPSDQHASRLASSGKVAARLAELQERSALRVEVTVSSLLDEAEQARKLAMDIESPAAAIAAIREKGILSGKRVERSEHGRPGEFEDMDADGLRDSISRDLEALGRQDLAAALTGRTGEAGKLTH